jgi:hypothetical protein
MGFEKSKNSPEQILSAEETVLDRSEKIDKIEKLNQETSTEKSDVKRAIQEIFKKFEKPKLVEVKMGEIIHESGNKIISTNFLSPCVGVIIYNKEKKEAYCGHYPTPQPNRYDEGLEPLLKEAKLGFGDLKELEAYVVGISADEKNKDGYEKDFFEAREFVIDLLKKYGLQDSKTHIKWSPISNGVARLKLHLESGKTEYELRAGDEAVYKGDLF